MSNINITYLEKIIHEMNSPLQNLGLIPNLMLDTNISMSEADKRENLQYIRNSTEKFIRLISMMSAITNLKSEKIKLSFVENDLIELINKEIKYHALSLNQDKSK